MLAATVVVAVVIGTVVALAGGAVVFTAATGVPAVAVPVNTVLLRPLVTGVAAFPVTMSTVKATDPWPADLAEK